MHNSCKETKRLWRIFRYIYSVCWVKKITCFYIFSCFNVWLMLSLFQIYAAQIGHSTTRGRHTSRWGFCSMRKIREVPSTVSVAYKVQIESILLLCVNVHASQNISQPILCWSLILRKSAVFVSVVCRTTFAAVHASTGIRRLSRITQPPSRTICFRRVLIVTILALWLFWDRFCLLFFSGSCFKTKYQHNTRKWPSFYILKSHLTSSTLFMQVRA